jgi:hypothetical protein
MISKFNEPAIAANKVEVQMFILRLPHVASDVNLIFNCPLAISPLSCITTDAVNHDVNTRKDFAFKTLQSFEINDWNLFNQAVEKTDDCDIEED